MTQYNHDGRSRDRDRPVPGSQSVADEGAHHLSKPFTPAQLLDKVRKALDECQDHGVNTNWIVRLAAMGAPLLVRAGLKRHSRAAFCASAARYRWMPSSV